MSLLEDVLDVLRIVLEYFGVSPDMVNTHTHTYTHTHTHTHLCYYHITESQTSIQGYQCAYQWHFLARSYFLCLCHLLCSWFQCGTVSCAVSIAAL